MAELVDRYALPGGVGAYQPTEPAALPPSYLRSVDQYLRRVELDMPTGRALLELTHPSPPCHTGGGGPLSGCPCLAAG